MNSVSNPCCSPFSITAKWEFFEQQQDSSDSAELRANFTAARQRYALLLLLVLLVLLALLVLTLLLQVHGDVVVAARLLAIPRDAEPSLDAGPAQGLHPRQHASRLVLSRTKDSCCELLQ